MKRLVNYVQQARERQRTRKQLLKLPDEALKDIDISRTEAYQEGHKFFWQ